MAQEFTAPGGRMSPEVAFAALEGADLGLWELDLVAGLAVFDDGYCRLLGYGHEELEREVNDYLTLVHPDDRVPLAEALTAHTSGGTAMFRCEYRVRTRGDGSWIWLEARGNVTERDASGKPVRMAGTVQDCSRRRDAEQARRLLEQQLAQVQRMESVGSLVGGIAHDFNNVLLAIAGQTELALADLEAGETAEVAESLGEIRDAAARAADMTRRLLSFGRQVETAWEVHDLGACLESFTPTLRQMVPASIVLEIDTHEAAPLWFHGDRGRIEQTVLNLCANAVDALGQRGRIVVATTRVEVSPAEVGAYPWATPGPHVCVSVTDNGPGIDPAVVSRVFDPFFTTKPPGEGSGLGLTVAYASARQHGGFLRLCTHTATEAPPPGWPGNSGSRFELLLPESVRVPVQAGASDQATSAANETSARSAREGGAVILIAEDDAPVRRVVERMLTGAGYRVIAARDGAEALELFAQHQAEIDMVLLDAIMPHKTGREVYEELISARPELKVMFASGYTADVLDHSFFERERRPLLAKPFTRELLLEKIAAVLEE